MSQLSCARPKENSYFGESCDRGAVSALLAVLFSSSLVIVLFAIVIDVGIIYQERRTLQNAADATALAIAQECAELGSGNPTLCQSINLTPASDIANRNSDDGKTSITEVCGLGSQNLDACPPSTNLQFDCKDSSLVGVDQYVRVRTGTLSKDSERKLEFIFAPLLEDANPNYSLRACAQVAWGAASEAPVVYPLALPICFYQDAIQKQHNAYNENNPEYLPAEDCPFTPVGSATPIQIDVPVIKGMAMFTAINGVNSGCPTIFDPRIVEVGDVLTPIAPGNPGEIVGICDPTLRQLGYAQTQNKAYENYLKDFVLEKTLYVPVIQYLDCGGASNCKRLKVGYFFSVIVKGIKLKNLVEVGYGKSGPSSIAMGVGWIGSDCDSNTYCFYGKFTRTTPPGPPRKIDPDQPNTGVNKVVLLP